MTLIVVPEDHPKEMMTGSANFVLGGIISSKGFKTVKDAFQEPSLKSMMLTYWKDQIITVQNGTYGGSKHAGDTLTSALLEHPKILLEHEDFVNVKINPLFKEVQALKLPFPKMVVVVGTPYDVNRLIPEKDRSGTEYGDGELRHFCSFCVKQSQSDGYVTIVVPLVDRKVMKSFLLEIVMTYGETPTGVPKIVIDVPAGQRSWMSQDGVRAVVRYVTEAIYMMTLNPATAQACVSIPTKEEIDKNKKRVRKDKKPLVEFKLITIDGKKPDPIKAPPAGTHASPKQHWRRGHWRHYASGKTVFIDPMLVGDEKNGKIIKDYAVGLYDDAKNKRVQQGLQ